MWEKGEGEGGRGSAIEQEGEEYKFFPHGLWTSIYSFSTNLSEFKHSTLSDQTERYYG